MWPNPQVSAIYKVKNGLLSIIKNEVFTFQENKIHKLRSGIQLVYNATHFGTGTISNLGRNEWLKKCLNAITAQI